MEHENLRTATKDYARIAMFCPFSATIFITNRLSLRQIACAVAAMENNKRKLAKAWLKKPFLEALYACFGRVA